MVSPNGGQQPHTLAAQRAPAPGGGDHTNKYAVWVADSETTRIYAGELVVVSAISPTDVFWVARRAQAPDDTHVLLVAFHTWLPANEVNTRYGLRQEGTAVEKYTLFNQDTSAATIGDLVYLSDATPGAWTLSDTGVPVGKVLRVGSTDGVVLLWPSYYYCCDGAGGGAITLDSLGDVGINVPAPGEVLHWDGTEWVNGSLPMTSVDWIEPGNTSGEILVWDAGGSVWATTETLPLTRVAAFSAWSATTGQYPVWNNTTGKFEPSTLSLVTTLNSLTDVNTAGVTTGDVLSYDGSGWVPGAVAFDLDDLSNVAAPAPTDGQALLYDDDTSTWVAATLGLNSLTDVDPAGPSDGDVLAYVQSSGKWLPRSWIEPAATEQVGSPIGQAITTVAGVVSTSTVSMTLTADNQEWLVVFRVTGAFAVNTDYVVAYVRLDGTNITNSRTVFPAFVSGEDQTLHLVYNIDAATLAALGSGTYDVEIWANTSSGDFAITNTTKVVTQVIPRYVQ